jgi:hypothetical protein
MDNGNGRNPGYVNAGGRHPFGAHRPATVRTTRRYAITAPWHFLNFFPDPHGHGSLRLTLLQSAPAGAPPGAPPEIPGTPAGAVGVSVR